MGLDNFEDAATGPVITLYIDALTRNGTRPLSPHLAALVAQANVRGGAPPVKLVTEEAAVNPYAAIFAAKRAKEMAEGGPDIAESVA